jgi:nucleoside-diphosphate-sugar epimerase
MKVLITGANGFIGRAITAELAKNSHEIIAVGRHQTKNLNQNIVKSANYFEADISDSKDLERLNSIEGIETVIHCAGLAHRFGEVKRADFWKVNVEGTENTVNLAKNIEAKNFILISSVSVYGSINSKEKTVNEESDCTPHDDYARSKLEGEKIARRICEREGINLTILRPATVIGEHDRGNVSRLIKAIDTGRFIWIGSGINRKSLIYKTDIAGACLLILEKITGKTEIYNVCAEAVSMKEIVDEIASELRKNIPFISIPVSLLQIVFSVNDKTVKMEKAAKLAETVKKWLAEDVYSAEKIRKDFDFTAKVSVKEAIRREVGAYLDGKNV